MNAGGWKIGDMVEDLPHLAMVEPAAEERWGQAFWYVAHVMTGREVSVAADIRVHGFRAYVPMRVRVCRVRGRCRHKPEALLGGYVFFEAVPDPRNWHLIRRVDDVIGILTLTNANVPVRVTEEGIGDYMAAEDMKMFDESVGPTAFEFVARDRVRIVAGGWQGYEATVTKVNRRQAEIVVLGAKGRRSVKLPVDLLRILA